MTICGLLVVDRTLPDRFGYIWAKLINGLWIFCQRGD